MLKAKYIFWESQRRGDGTDLENMIIRAHVVFASLIESGFDVIWSEHEVTQVVTHEKRKRIVLRKSPVPFRIIVLKGK